MKRFDELVAIVASIVSFFVLLMLAGAWYARRRLGASTLLEIDGRPISSFGTDAVLLATPTGSTAYSFSAGGPIIWPTAEVLLLVPLGAHALFTRPLVVTPTSTLAVTIAEDSTSAAMLWCDSRRSFPLPQGSRIEATRDARPLRLARLSRAPFADRLVAKFHLPVEGFRRPRP